MVRAIESSSMSKPREAESSELLRLRQTADRVVGTVFFGDVLKSMRESCLRSSFGHGGRGEEAFQAQLDQIWAEEAGRAKSFDIGGAIYRRLEDQQRSVVRRKEANGGLL